MNNFDNTNLEQRAQECIDCWKARDLSLERVAMNYFALYIEEGGETSEHLKRLIPQNYPLRVPTQEEISKGMRLIQARKSASERRSGHMETFKRSIECCSGDTKQRLLETYRDTDRNLRDITDWESRICREKDSLAYGLLKE
jgi:hypothetical protein